MMDRGKRKTRTGVVVSERMDKTVVVRVQRITRHPLYGKTIRKSKKYYVHDEKNEAKMGDRVKIMETRPISRLKRWRLAEVIARATG
ncbi:MAG: 30S ribosomal protein S17 [Candidatus Tritonobacter lacicola]|nr:30S ribosomal protein S17 [Candidatus Tritonobacter lacicola]